jgi:hypothetical protein
MARQKEGEVNLRLPALIAAAAATDVALVMQSIGTGVVAGLIVCLALVVAISKAPVAMVAVALVIAALLGAGAVRASAIPGVEQVNEGWVAAKHWRDRQIEVASCRYRQLGALSAGDATALDAVQRDCA